MTVAAHVPDNLPACSIETASSAAADDVDAPPPSSDYSNQAVIIGRLKPGRGRESHRVVHVFPLAAESPHTVTLTARCGKRLRVADLQQLPRLIGMPCDRCLLRSLGMADVPQITGRRHH